MTRQQRLLSQLRKLEEKVTTLHDQMNDHLYVINEIDEKVSELQGNSGDEFEDGVNQIHDAMTAHFNTCNEFVKMSTYCYVMSLSCVQELEGLMEDDGGFGEG